MELVEQWNRLVSGLDPSWSGVRLALALDDATTLARAHALLGPAGPGRRGGAIRVDVVRRGGVGPETIRRLLRRLDEEGIGGRLELLAADAAQPERAAPPARSLAEEWDAARAVLPSDWSDLLCELELTSSDHVDPAALNLAPLNPLRIANRPAFTFRCAQSFGYGASPGMVRRCLERLAQAGIPGRVRVARVLSDTHPVGTQGPVWYIGGKAV